MLPSLLVAIAFSAAGALPSTPADYLAAIDLDGDGRIGLSEYRDYMSRGFRRMDADGNGTLEGDELPVPGARTVRLRDHLGSLEAAFRRQDANGDGQLDERELAAPPR